MTRTRRLDKPLTIALAALGIFALAGAAQAASQPAGAANALVVAMSEGHMKNDSGMKHDSSMSGGSMSKMAPKGDEEESESYGKHDDAGMSHQSNMDDQGSMNHMAKPKGNMENEDDMSKDGKDSMEKSEKSEKY